MLVIPRNWTSSSACSGEGIIIIIIIIIFFFFFFFMLDIFEIQEDLGLLAGWQFGVSRGERERERDRRHVVCRKLLGGNSNGNVIQEAVENEEGNPANCVWSTLRHRVFFRMVAGSQVVSTA